MPVLKRACWRVWSLNAWREKHVVNTTDPIRFVSLVVRCTAIQVLFGSMPFFSFPSHFSRNIVPFFSLCSRTYDSALVHVASDLAADVSGPLSVFSQHALIFSSCFKNACSLSRRDGFFNVSYEGFSRSIYVTIELRRHTLR